jgi:CRP/FNR family transcriptional regulator
MGQLWIFKDLKPEELASVAARTVRRTFESGRPVFLQGDQAKSLFLIKSGRVRLSRAMENGAEIIMDIRKSGDYLGECLLNDLQDDYRYPVSAWCLEPVALCSFSRQAFESIILEMPAVGLSVVKTMAGRLVDLTERIEALSLAHLEEKLHAVLLGVARRHGRRRPDDSWDLELQLTHEDLGFLVGAHRVSVTRSMKRLTDSGRVRRDGKSLVIRGGSASVGH